MHGVADNVVRRKVSARDPESQHPCEPPQIRGRRQLEPRSAKYVLSSSTYGRRRYSGLAYL
jgi:hypothetical protein